MTSRPPSPTPGEVLEFLKAHSLAVQASVSALGRPQAAVVGVVTTDAFEIFFDTETTSRKLKNLRENPWTSLVVGWDEEQTVQVEGVADEPAGESLERLKDLYFSRFPDGQQRASWPTIAYVRVKPTWVRYSDFRGRQPVILELPSNLLGNEPPGP